MREVKFRGQRIDIKAWEYGYPIYIDGKVFIFPLGSSIHHIAYYGINGNFGHLGSGDKDCFIGEANQGGKQGKWLCEVIPETVGQLHPHRDENGKEIYEGDILAITTQDKQDILVVCRFGTIQRRMDTGFLCDITGFYFERSDGLNSLPIVKNYKGKHDLEMMQIVGNIYEHPNLLYTQSPTTE